MNDFDQRPLVVAIVDALLLLENSSDSEINPDIAVRGMESITHSLHQLDLHDQVALRAVLTELADSSSDSPYSRFVAGLGDMLDLSS